MTITVINQPSKVLDRGQTIVLSVRQDTCAGSRGHPYQFAPFSGCAMLRTARRERGLRRSRTGDEAARGVQGHGERRGRARVLGDN